MSHETIYRSLFVQARGGLRKELTACLRSGRTRRRPHNRARYARVGRLRGMIMIRERPAEAADRAVPGHWEGDLIIGKGARSAIGTLVARKYETSSTCFRISYMGYGRVYVAPPERRELERRLRSRSGRIEDARRARVILLLAAGHSYREICTELRCSHEYIARWKTRFQEDRLGGLDSRHVGRQAWVVTPKLEARVLNRTRQPPSDGSTHWSSRKLAKEFDLPPIRWTVCLGGVSCVQHEQSLVSNGTPAVVG